MSTTAPSSTAGTDAGDFSAADEPFALFEDWLAEAAAREMNDPNAMALATVDSDGMPNVRMVLLKGIDSGGHPLRGFVFYTNLESAKGRELAKSGKAALDFHWKSLRRQVRVRGHVTSVTSTEADDYFASRARGSRLGAWASAQSRPLESRFALEAAVAKVTARYPLGEIPRPPHWSGFRVTPVEIEFWHDRAFRLHERIAFRRPGPDSASKLSEVELEQWNSATAWTKVRLYP